MSTPKIISIRATLLFTAIITSGCISELHSVVSTKSAGPPTRKVTRTEDGKDEYVVDIRRTGKAYQLTVSKITGCQKVVSRVQPQVQLERRTTTPPAWTQMIKMGIGFDHLAAGFALNEALRCQFGCWYVDIIGGAGAIAALGWGIKASVDGARSLDRKKPLPPEVTAESTEHVSCGVSRAGEAAVQVRGDHEGVDLVDLARTDDDGRVTLPPADVDRLARSHNSATIVVNEKMAGRLDLRIPHRRYCKDVFQASNTPTSSEQLKIWSSQCWDTEYAAQLATRYTVVLRAEEQEMRRQHDRELEDAWPRARTGTLENLDNFVSLCQEYDGGPHCAEASERRVELKENIAILKCAVEYFGEEECQSFVAENTRIPATLVSAGCSALISKISSGKVDALGVAGSVATTLLDQAGGNWKIASNVIKILLFKRCIDESN